MASLFNQNNTPINFNDFKSKNTQTPFTKPISSAQQNYVSSLMKNKVPNTVAYPKPQSNPVVSSNPSATSPTAIKPTTPSVAGASYANPIQQQTTVTTPLASPFGSVNMNPPQPSQQISTTTTSPTTAENPRDTYVKYLSQYLAPSQQEKDKAVELADIQNKSAAKAAALKQEQIALQDASGGTTGGAREASNQMGVRGNRELADIALQENAATNTLNALRDTRTEGFKSAQPLQIGNDLIDPSTGKILYTKPDTGFELGKDQIRYEKDPVTGLYKQVAQGAISSTVMKDESGELLTPTEALALGVPYGTTKGQAYGSTPQKSLTEGESKAKQYGLNAQTANDALNTSQYNLGLIEVPIPNALKSAERQAFEQSARAFVNAVLRRESGATITDSEFLNKQKELIPQAGDSTKVLEQKKIARANAVKSTIEAGQAFNNQTSQSTGTGWGSLGDN